jgi:hypothetical protein
MGFLDALLGRRKPSRPDLDKLFEVPAAATTLSLNGWTPTGVGSVCFRSAEGIAFSQTQSDAQDLIEFGGRKVEQTVDSFGFTWLTVRAGADDVDPTSSVVTDLHAVNSSLESAGFGELLLCTLINFASTTPGTTKTLAIVYLYKQGTFYPFAPRPGTTNQRDNATELAIRPMLEQDLPVEPELSRWLAVWGAPGL